MSPSQPNDPAADPVEEGRRVLLSAAVHLERTARALDERFARAVSMIATARGTLVTTGIGKAGHVARKVSATFASTGTESIYLHPSDAVHGDLGRVGKDDVVVMLSNSGMSDELIRLLSPIRGIGAKVVALTGDCDSVLGREADVCIAFGQVSEAGRHGLAPTTSTTVLQALGDALAMAVLAQREFSPSDFARYHPAGKLGRSLMRVSDVMRRGDANPLASAHESVFEVLRRMDSTPGRPGAVSVVGQDGKLVGFYTHGDFCRQSERAIGARDTDFFTSPISMHMTQDPLTISEDRLVAEAMRLLRERRIDQLPVVDAVGKPIGLVDVQDLLDIKVFG
jgi:arabinose-5-phosphate isomerase